MMTDLAVTMRVTTKHGNAPIGAPIKTGGAGAQAGGVDGLEGAFAAILDAAATGKAAMPVPGSTESVLSAEALAATAMQAATAAEKSSKDGKTELLSLQAVRTADGSVTTASGIQIRPNVKQADSPVTSEDAATDPLATAEAKPRKNSPRAKNDAESADPAALQAAGAAAVSAQAQIPAQLAEQPVLAKKDSSAIDAEGRAGATVNGTLVVPAAVKQTQINPQAAKAEAADKAETSDTSRLAETLLPMTAEARVAHASSPAPAKADAPAPGAMMAAQTDNASAEDSGNPQTGTNSGGEERPTTFQIARAESKAANDDAAIATADPFRSIIDSLPPVVQSQISVQGAPGTEAVTRTSSTSELLGNQVIDMGVSGQWIDRMAREIAKLSEGTGHSRFQLMPPNLGRIQVDLWQGDNQTNVRLLTETDEAARRLREGQSALEASARLGSLSLGSVSVEKSSTPLDRDRDQNNSQNQRQQAENGDNGQQQASAQAQGQGGQGRRNTGASNVGGFSAVMGFEQQAESEQSVRAPRADDPRIRFA